MDVSEQLRLDGDGGAERRVTPVGMTMAGEPVFRLAPDTALLSLAGRPVLFSRTAETVFDLQGDAAGAAKLLEKGARASDLIAMMIGSGWSDGEARDLVIEILRDWSRLRLLAMDRMRSFAWSETYTIADMAFELSSTSTTRIFEPSDIFRRAPATNAASCSFTLAPLLGRVAVRFPSGEVVVAPEEEAAPELKSAVIGELLRTSGSIALHAACLVSKGEAVLLFGAPGAGKSTLAAALSRRGFSYAGDDITLLCDGQARGVCVALTLKEGASRLLANEGEEPAAALPYRRRDGVRLSYEWPSSVASEASYPIAAMIRLDRATSGPPSLRDRDPLALMRDVLAEAFSSRGSASLADLEMLDRVFARSASLDLAYSDLWSAVEILADRFL